MKRYLLSAVFVAVSSAAFAQVVTPGRIGTHCWTTTDHRGFGYWESCEALSSLVQARTEINVQPARTPARRGTISTRPRVPLAATTERVPVSVPVGRLPVVVATERVPVTVPIGRLPVVTTERVPAALTAASVPVSASSDRALMAGGPGGADSGAAGGAGGGSAGGGGGGGAAGR